MFFLYHPVAVYEYYRICIFMKIHETFLKMRENHIKNINSCEGGGSWTSNRYTFPTARTSDSLNEGLPIKMTREKFKKKDIFSMKKIIGSTLDLSTKAVISLDKYQLKNMG